MHIISFMEIKNIYIYIYISFITLLKGKAQPMGQNFKNNKSTITLCDREGQ